MNVAVIEISGDRIEVNTRWDEKELVKQIPGARWSPQTKTWSVPLSWASCVVLRGIFRDDLTIGAGIAEWGWRKKTDVDEMLKMRALVAPDWEETVQSRGPIDLRKLYPFQRVGAEFLWTGREVLLGDEMGTGKTIQALTAMAGSLPALVACPNSVKTTWETEARTWLPSATPYVVTGGAVGRRRILEAALRDDSALVIINYEAVRLVSRLAPYGSIRLKRCRECDKHGEVGLRAAQCEVHPKELDQFNFYTVVIDEAHRIKSPQSKQTRAVWACAHQPSVVNRWALTGTPIANHPGDLWSILHCISPTQFPTKTHFIDRYCLQAWNAFGGLDIVGLNPATRDEFYSIFDPHFRRMPKDLVLKQLPPKVYSTRWVDLTPKQAKMYRQLDGGVGAIVGDEVLVADNDLTRRLRLLELASATIELDDEGRVWLTDPSPKIDELVDLLDGELAGKQVVVCAEFRRLIELASSRLTKLGISHGLITGNVIEFERRRVLEEFQAGRLRVLLFTIKAGGTGLTMTAADTLVRLQRSDSMIDNRQADDRVHRIGSERHSSVHIIDIVARDTVEEPQMHRLQEKYLRLQQITRDRATIAAAGGSTRHLDEEEATIMASDLL